MHNYISSALSKRVACILLEIRVAARALLQILLFGRNRESFCLASFRSEVPLKCSGETFRLSQMICSVTARPAEFPQINSASVRNAPTHRPNGQADMHARCFKSKSRRISHLRNESFQLPPARSNGCSRPIARDRPHEF